MNNKYKELYNYLLDNKMTSLDENSFYNEYSQNDNKFSELYSYLQTNKMTSLDPETFKLEYFGTPIIKKKSQVESTESDLEDGSLERLSTTTTRPSESSTSGKTETFTGYPGKEKNKYDFKESDGVAHWYEPNPKKDKALTELNSMRNAPPKPGPTGQGSMPAFSPEEIKRKELQYNKIPSKKIIEDDDRVRALNKQFGKNASLDPIDQVYTNYDEQKKDNEYRVNDNNWQRKVPGAKSWTTVTDERAINGLNRRYGKEVKYKAELKSVKPEPKLKFADVNTSLVSKTEEDAVGILSKKYGKYGFTFEQSGYGTDYIVAYNKDKTKEITVGFDEANPEEALKLKNFLEQNASKEKSNTALELEKKIKSLNSTHTSPGVKGYDILDRTNTLKYVLSDEYKTKFSSLSFDEMEDQINNYIKTSFQKSEDLDKFWASDAYKIFKKKKKEEFGARDERIDLLYTELQSAKSPADIKNIKSKISAYLTEDVIQDQVKNYSMQLNDLDKSAKILASDQKKYLQSVDDFNKLSQSGQMTQEEFDLAKKNLEDQAEKLGTRADFLMSSGKSIQNDQKKLNVVAGKYVAELSKSGGFFGGIMNSVLTGISKSIIEVPSTFVISLTESSGSEYFKLSPEEKQYYKDKGYSKDQTINLLVNNKIKDFKAETRKNLIDVLGADQTTQEYMKSSDRGFFAKAIFGVAESAPAMLMGVGGYAASFTGLASQAYSSIEDEMLNDADFETSSAGDRAVVAVPYAVLMGVLENFGLKNVVKGSSFTGGIIKDILINSMKQMPKDGTKGLLQNIMTKEVKSVLAKGAFKIVNGAIAEFETGATQALVLDIGLKALYNKISQSGMTEEQISNLSGGEMFATPDTLGELTSTVLEDGLAEAIGGATMSTFTTVVTGLKNGNISLYNEDDLNYLKEISQDSEFKKIIVAKLKTEMLKGNLTKSEAQERLDAMNQLSSVIESIPDGLSEKDQINAVNILSEKNRLEKERQGKDPALVTAQTDRINEINEELKNISKNATKENNIVQQEGTAEGGDSTVASKVQQEELESVNNRILKIEAAAARGELLEDSKPGELKKLKDRKKELESTPEAKIERRREEDLSAYNEEELNEVYSVGSDQTVGEFINAKYDAELAALGTTQKSTQVATLRAEEQAELLKAIPKIESYKVNGEIDKTLMPKTVLAKYNKIYDKYDKLISPLLETTGEVAIDKPVITTNTTAEVERVKSLSFEAEDGATFNIDGTKYEGVGLVVAVDSMNTTTEELTPEMVADFVAERQKMIGDAGVVKAGIYKFPNSNQVSIDLSVVVPETSREQALEFARLAGQESLFDLETFENIKTGATGQNPMKFTPEQHREISKALKEGRMPNVFGTTVEQEVEAIGQFLSGTDAQIDQKASMIVNKKISKAVSRAAKALSRIIPGTKFIVHDTDESYRAATKEEGLKQSSNGEFNPKTNTIHINGTSANARTVAHEVFHAILINKVKTDANAAAVTKRMVQAIASKINNNPELKKKLENFISNYEENIQDEEKLAELVGMLSENYNSFSTSIKDIIARWIDKLANIFGLDPFNRNETYDMLNTIARKVAKGEVISEADVKTISYKKDVELNAETRKSLSEQDSIKIAKEVVDKTIKGKAIPTWIQKKTSNKVKFVSFSGEINQKNVKENAPSSYNSIAAKFSNYNTFNINVKQELNNSLVGASKESINKALEYNKKKLLPKINSLLKEIKKIKSNKKLTKEEKLSKISIRNEAIVNIKKIAKMKDLNDQLDAVLNIEHKSTKDSLYNSMFYDLSTNLKRLKGLELANKSEDIYKKAKDIVKSNLLSVYNSVSPRIRQISKLWYDGANLIAQDMANSYELTNEQAAAIIATQSPQMPWFDNLHLADVIMNLMHSESNSIFTKELFDYYVSKSEGYAEQKKYIPTLSKAIGTPLSKLSDLDAAIFIRAYYDTKLSRKAPIRIPTGTAISEDQKGDSSFSGYSVIAKGISIFRDGSIENISNQLGEANKVRNFYMNIVDPSDKRAVTIDTHAMAIALFKPLASNDYEVNFDAATFAFYADAYRELADELGIEARALQSITWEAARAIFPAKEKAKSGYKEKISNIWDELVSGNKSLYKVQEEIFNQAQDPNITEWSEYINILKDEKTRTNVSGRIVGLEGAGATNNMGAVPGTSIGKSKPSGGAGVSSRGAKVSPRKQLSPEVSSKLTEDKRGNFVFHHYSNEKRDVIKPGTGENIITGKEEGGALSAVGGLAMYYTMDNQVEPGVGNVLNTVLVPNGKVYDFNSDPDNFYDEAKKRFEAARPSQSYSPNYQLAFITQVANENGYDMVVAKWRNNELRAQTTMSLESSKDNVSMKPIAEETYKVGDNVEVYGSKAKITSIDGEIITFKGDGVGGQINFKRFPKNISKQITPRKQITEEVTGIEESMEPRKQNTNTINDIVRLTKAQGFSDAAIRQYLKDQGYSDKNINDAMEPDTGDVTVSKIREASKKELLSRQKKMTIIDRIRFIRNKIIDRQSDIKRLIKGIGSKESIRAYNLLVSKAGASGFANYRFKNAEADIYKGLSKNDLDTLEDIIYARRMVAINESRAKKGLEPYTGMDGYSEVKALKDLDAIKNKIGEKKFNDLSKRATIYFGVFSENLKKLYESGRINEETYINLRDIEYSPIKTIKYIIGYNLDAETIDKEASKLGVSKKDIMALTDSNENAIIFDSKWLLLLNVMSVEGRAFENKMLNEFSDAIDGATQEQRDAISEFIIDNPIVKQTSTGSIQYKYNQNNVPVGYSIVSFFKNGVKKDLVVKEAYATQLLDIKSSNQGLNLIGTLTGAKILRFFATGGNPLFIIGNTAVDFQNILFFSDVYSKFKLFGGAQLSYDFVRKFLKGVSTSNRKNKIYNEYVEHGGAMDFLSNDGLRALKSLSPKNKILNISQKVLIGYGNIMSFLGEKSELAFRLAVYDKVKGDEISKFKKENGRDPDAKELDDIMYEATRNARETMDFNQGGSWVKAADNMMPYLNASMQGFRRPLEYANNNPLGFTSSLVQASVMAGSVAALSLAALMRSVGDDDEEKKKVLDVLDSLSDYEKATHHIIFTGKKNKDGEYEYYRIKKLPVLSVISTITEQFTYKYLLSEAGIKYDVDQEVINKSISASTPFTPSDIASRNPLISGLLTYSFNWDSFTGEKIFREPRDKKIAATAEGMYDDKVDQIYKEIAPSLGLSPIRTKAAIEKIVTSENTNPTISIFYASANGFFNKDGYGAEFSDAFSNVFDASARKLKRFTNKNNIRYKEEDNIENLEMIIETDIYNKEQKVYNTIKNTYKDGKELSNGELVDLIKTNFEKKDHEKYVKKYYTYIKNMNIDRSILDILYEDTPEVQALRLYNRYGSELDSEETKILSGVIRKAHMGLSKEALYIYNKKYSNRK
jgi:hypothetical protein